MNTDTAREALRPLRLRLRRLLRPALLGTLRRHLPLSHDFGYDRGTPVDRYYIEGFLSEHRADVAGTVLEVKESTYTQRFGTGVIRSDVLDIDAANPRATVVADLTEAPALASGSFDCFILTQTLQFIYRTEAAVREAHRVLRPGGVLLVTVPAVSRLGFPPEVGADYWRFTAASCSSLFGEVFDPGEVTVRAHGNVLTCIAFLAGMAVEDLTQKDLEVDDPLFPLVVTVRAVKR